MRCYAKKEEFLVTCHSSAADKIPQESVIQGNTAAFVCNKSTADEMGPILPESKVIKLEKQAIQGTGPGRLLSLDNPIKLSKAIDMVKAHLGLSHLRLAMGTNSSPGTKKLCMIIQSHPRKITSFTHRKSCKI